VIIPPSPGVLNAYGDAMTGLRDEAARTFIQGLAGLTDAAMLEVIESLSDSVHDTLARQGVAAEDQTLTYQVDMRYHGQGFEIPIDLDVADFQADDRAGLDKLASAFDAEHERLFSFLLDNDHEIVNVRVTANGPRPTIAAAELPEGDGDPSNALQSTTRIWVAGQEREAGVYDRLKLRAADVVTGPAIVADMDATTLVLPDHTATVHPSGSLLIRPTEA
jgi:N-methylhydantoinase A